MKILLDYFTVTEMQDAVTYDLIVFMAFASHEHNIVGP